MKKIYNYRNTTNINCGVYNCPIGFKYEDYPEINKLRHENKQNPIDLSRRWMLYENQDSGYFHLNIDFKNQKLLFDPNPPKKSTVRTYTIWNWYYNIENKSIGTNSTNEFKQYFYYNGNVNYNGEKILVPITIKTLSFTVGIEDITLMEVESKWWKSYIYIHLNFSRILRHGTDYIKLQFDKVDKEDADFIVKEINTIRRMIQSKQQEKLLQRWEEEHDEQEVGQDY